MSSLLTNGSSISWCLETNHVTSSFSDIVLLNSSVGKESACNAGDLGLIPGPGSMLEKEMATHSSTLAWRIPWTEEPDGL